MSLITSRAVRWGAVALIWMSILPFVGLMSAQPVFASQSICRSDPIVVLSDLKTLDLSATVYDSSSDLHSVSYTLHLPPGVFPLLVVPTDALIGRTEHFTSHNDMPAGHFGVTTYVSTGAHVSVQAAGFALLAHSYVASGWSNQNITVNI